MFYYAQLNNENICNAVGEYEEEMNFEHMIQIDSYDISYLGRQYNNGVWEGDAYAPEPVEPQPSQLDRIESAVNDIAKNNTSYAEMASAIAEGVNDIEC